MRSWVFFVPLVLMGCGGSQQPAEAPAAVTYGGGDGKSCETAVRILGAQHESEGVAAEYSWLKQHHPGFSLLQQSLIQCNGRPADRLQIRTPDSQSRAVFFDIGDFFGKF